MPHDSARTPTSFLTLKFTVKFERDHPIRGQQMQLGWVKIGHFRRKTRYNSNTVHSLCDLQNVCNRLATWAEKWQLRIVLDKCNIQRISNCDGVNITDCSPSYKIGAHVLH